MYLFIIFKKKTENLWFRPYCALFSFSPIYFNYFFSIELIIFKFFKIGNNKNWKKNYYLMQIVLSVLLIILYICVAITHICVCVIVGVQMVIHSFFVAWSSNKNLLNTTTLIKYFINLLLLLSAKLQIHFYLLLSLISKLIIIIINIEKKKKVTFQNKKKNIVIKIKTRQ